MGTKWVEGLNQLAQRQHKDGSVRLVLVEGVGHDSARLTPMAQKALAEVLTAK